MISYCYFRPRLTVLSLPQAIQFGYTLCHKIFTSCPFYESQPVGLAEVPTASEASLGGPHGAERAKVAQTYVIRLCLFCFRFKGACTTYQLSDGGVWRGSISPWSINWGWEKTRWLEQR